jgi:hypothetical protein
MKMKFQMLDEHTRTTRTILMKVSSTREGEQFGGSELTAVAAAVELELAADYIRDDYGEDTVEYEVVLGEATAAADLAVEILMTPGHYTREYAKEIIREAADEIGHDLDMHHTGSISCLAQWHCLHSRTQG